MYVRIGLLGLVWFAVSWSVAEAQTLIVRLVWNSESNQIGAGFGSSVASAGDVNGDGYDDILVGASNYNGALTNQGSAALFLGSPDGPSKLPDWTAEGSQAFANFGASLAGADDVNGDGYDDVIVGAPRGTAVRTTRGGSSSISALPPAS